MSGCRCGILKSLESSFGFWGLTSLEICVKALLATHTTCAKLPVVVASQLSFMIFSCVLDLSKLADDQLLTNRPFVGQLINLSG